MQFNVRETCPVSQKPSLEHAVMAVEVVISKIKATAPPCRFPPMLQSSAGTTIENTVVELCGSEGVGSKVTDSRFKMCGSTLSWPWERLRW